LFAYWVTDPQNGQTRYSGGISLPQFGHGFSAPPGVGSGAAAAAGGGGAASRAGGWAAGGGGAPRDGRAAFGAGRAGAAPLAGGLPGGAVIPLRGVPWPCWSFHWLNGVYDGWRFHQSQNAPSL